MLKINKIYSKFGKHKRFFSYLTKNDIFDDNDNMKKKLVYSNR